LSGSNSKSDSMSEYRETAFRSDSMPKQRSLENPGGFAKALEGGDLIERLAWANYAVLDIHVRPNSAETYQKRASGRDKRNLAGPAWTHRQKPAEFIKTHWQLLLMFAGSFADKGMMKFFAGAVVLAGFFSLFAHGYASNTNIFHCIARDFGASSLLPLPLHLLPRA